MTLFVFILTIHSLQKHFIAAYSKYNDPELNTSNSSSSSSFLEEKGFISSSNRQDMRHVCQTQGFRSKCHVCESFACGSSSSTTTTTSNETQKQQQKQQTCHFQIQGISTSQMSINIPTSTNVPWAVNGRHRYDYGGSNTTHVCMYLSSQWPCMTHDGRDYSNCPIRCWGNNDALKLPQWTHAPAPPPTADSEEEEEGPEVQVPWMIMTPGVPQEQSVHWEYPKTHPQLPHSWNPKDPDQRGPIPYSPQGFTFTLAGSSDGQAGFQDGKATQARYDVGIVRSILVLRKCVFVVVVVSSSYSASSTCLFLSSLQ